MEAAAQQPGCSRRRVARCRTRPSRPPAGSSTTARTASWAWDRAPAPGEGDPELINAGKQPVTLLPGAAYSHHTDAFMMMRGGHLDVTVLGAFQVSERGDLAHWATDQATLPPAVGGAMDLAVGAKRVLVMTRHTTRDGRPKLVPRCTYPLTAADVVDRVYTDLAVLDVVPEGFLVREMAPGVSREHLESVTDADLEFALTAFGG